MKCVNFHGDQWISNEMINHLIRKTNQLCQRETGSACENQDLRCWGNHNIFMILSHQVEQKDISADVFFTPSDKDLNLLIWKIVCKPVTFTNYKTQWCFFEILLHPGCPQTLRQSRERTLAGGLDSVLQFFALLIRPPDKQFFSLTNYGLRDR